MKILQIERVNYSEAKSVIKSIRIKVFQEEQKVPPSLEFDGLDNSAIQLLAYIDCQPIGTARIRDLGQQTAKIERLAVLPEARGFGVGLKLMETALKIIRENDHNTVVVHAQEYIKSLYRKLGFEPLGNSFEEANITHLKMVKKIEQST